MVIRNGFYVWIGLVLFCFSCNIINPEENTPSYLTINKIEFIDSVTNLPAAAKVQQFADAWVFINDNFVGVYPLPASFPIFFEGEHKVSVSAGILKNGISSTRIAYPYFTQYSAQAKFIKETETAVFPRTTYDAIAKFKFVEDFENTSSNFDTVTLNSDVKIDRTNDPSLVFQGSFSGVVVLEDTLDRFLMQTTAQYSFARKSVPTYLEMNYKTDVELQIGLFASNGGPVNVVPKINLKPSNGEWKKIYIDFDPEINVFETTTRFRIFVKANKPSDVSKALIYFDNIKLVF